MLYMTLVDGEVEGPWDLRQLVDMKETTLETLLCPEFELGQWRAFGDEIKRRPDIDFLWRLRANSEKLLLQNRALRKRALELAAQKEALDKDLTARLQAAEDAACVAAGKEAAAREELADVRERLKRVAGKVGAEKNELKRLDAEIDRLKTDEAKAKWESERHKAAAKNAEERLADAEGQLRRVGGDMDALRERLRGAERERIRLRAEADENSRGMDALRPQLDAAVDRARKAEEQNRALREHWDAGEQAALEERRLLAQRLETIRTQLAEREKLFQQTQQELEKAQGRAEAAESKMRQMQTHWRGSDQEYAAELGEIKKAAARDRELRAKVETQLEQAQQQLKDFKKSKLTADASAMNQVSDLKGEISKLKAVLVQKSSRIEILETQLGESAAAPMPPVLVPPAPPRAGGAAAPPVTGFKGPDAPAALSAQEEPGREPSAESAAPPTPKSELTMGPVRKLRRDIWVLIVLLAAALGLWSWRLMQDRQAAPPPAQPAPAAENPSLSTPDPLPEKPADKPAARIVPEADPADAGTPPPAFPGFVSLEEPDFP